MLAVIRKHVLVHGKVQGIGYRYSTRAEASRRGISGFARNLADGRVEIELEGDATSVNDMIGWLRNGPPDAVVESLDVNDIETHNDQEFVIRY